MEGEQFKEWMAHMENILTDSMKAMVKLDYSEQLLNRVLDKNINDKYRAVTWNEIIDRAKN